MEKLKILLITNMIAYFSFIIFIILRCQDAMNGIFALIFGLAPYIIVAYSMIIFYTEPKKLKKRIRSLTISDLLIRAIAMFFSFVFACLVDYRYKV